MNTLSATLEETPEAVRSALENGLIVLIDVREPGEYATARIAGALLFPLSTFDPYELPVGGRPIVLCCGSGKRSAAAFDVCRRAGVTIRSHLAGGLQGWRAAGLPVCETSSDTGEMRYTVETAKA